MNFEDIVQTFLAESREQLQSMEQNLLELEQAPDDGELLNAIFRAVHTIKGSAGVVSLDFIIDFTHTVEHLLDEMREGRVGFDTTLAACLLSCRDHIAALLDAAEDGLADKDGKEGQLDPKLKARGNKLLKKVAVYLPKNDAVPTLAKDPHVTGATIESSGGGPVDADTWHISLRCGEDLMRKGMDPLSLIRFLASHGEIVHITTLDDALPEAAAMDPEACYLGFEIDLRSSADKATLAGVFEFVEDDCIVKILPPNSKTSHYIDLIRSLPEGEERLGEILVVSGALTKRELQEGLALQRGGDGAEQEQASRPIGELLVGEGVVQTELVEAALSKQTNNREKRANESKYIRVQADKLDHLINLVGEMVIASASASTVAERSKEPAMHEAASSIAMLVEAIRDHSLKMRMVPIGETFQRFQRVVRDLSQELNKDIALLISGADTELDKTVVDKIGDPLMHLVRNSIDHGIETTAERLQAGKPAKGNLRLNAYHESGAIVIEVGDDGGGLNTARILAKARERGLVGPEQSLSEHEIHNLIFEAGFSTADKVSNISGRGVGMDVVRRNIESLRGSVEVTSIPAEGTTLRIRLPLTLAIIDGFLMRVGDACYVVPLDMVVECVELTSEQREDTHGRAFINLRGEVLPFIRLRDYFREEGRGTRRENIIVVNYAGQKAGLVVDELLGEYQTVIKPLGDLFRELSGVSGSTILGNGRVALILDVPALMHMVARRGEGLSKPRRHSA